MTELPLSWDNVEVGDTVLMKAVYWKLVGVAKHTEPIITEGTILDRTENAIRIKIGYEPLWIDIRNATPPLRITKPSSRDLYVPAKYVTSNITSAHVIYTCVLTSLLTALCTWLLL